MTNSDFFLCCFIGEGKCDGYHHWEWCQIKENYWQTTVLNENEGIYGFKTDAK